ncbi:sprouty-related, EVH1 domain-containing protein 1-like [Musca domestica]|uniref:Sprouty-related, EVH1 domain-containing protein 1-like n=1 Tax=Musca domestica TaxID=7370 RepID=A0ABM3V196_MUSDO|nr:sprouty-related, EVH1 domain-containing protein 1-like [Musca domestica]
MTEGHESDFLVTVRAQVMTRDESTEGWLPLAGGGLANVSIRKRARLSPGATGHEYIIYGRRISDQSVILSCVINRDLKYYKVMPTFHHWRAGKQRNGLTFQAAADARAFDKGVLRAYNELIDGMAKSNPSIICPPLTKYDSVGEDDVFMTLDLPCESLENKQKGYSSPEGSENSHSFKDRGERYTESSQDKNDKEVAKIHYISGENSCLQTTPSLPSMTSSAQNKTTSMVNTHTTTSTTVTTVETSPVIAPSENYSYVTLTAVHDYNYPVVDQPVAAQVLTRCDSITTLKKLNAIEASHCLAGTQSSPISNVLIKDPEIDILKHKMQQKSNPVAPIHNQMTRCRYCQELYNDEWNRKGACEFAPDCFRSGFECISGIGCARCMLYHFMSDSEGETPQHPCECANESGCTKRWLGLTLLSLLVPCLWCYPPLRVCHLIGIACGICGGKHKPQV